MLKHITIAVPGTTLHTRWSSFEIHVHSYTEVQDVISVLCVSIMPINSASI